MWSKREWIIIIGSFWSFSYPACGPYWNGLSIWRYVNIMSYSTIFIFFLFLLLFRWFGIFFDGRQVGSCICLLLFRWFRIFSVFVIFSFVIFILIFRVFLLINRLLLFRWFRIFFVFVILHDFCGRPIAQNLRKTCVFLCVFSLKTQIFRKFSASLDLFLF